MINWNRNILGFSKVWHKRYKYVAKILIAMLTFWVESICTIDTDMYRQEGLAMDSPLSPTIANIYIVFWKFASRNKTLKPILWQRYVGDNFIPSPHQENVQVMLHHMNSINLSKHFTMEKETDNHLAFLVVLIIRMDYGSMIFVYRKPTFMDDTAISTLIIHTV